MARHKMVNGVAIPLTPAEEAERDQAEIDFTAKRKRHEIEAAKTKYQRDRKAEYPPATDYLDGIVKGDQAQIDKYVSDCLAVKQRFPK